MSKVSKAKLSRSQQRTNIDSQLMAALDGHRVKRLPKGPPTHVSDPAVTRTVRIEQGYACTGAAPSSTNTFTYTQMASQDALDYTGSLVARYQYMRVEKVQTYVNVSARTTATAVGNGGPSRVTLSDTTAGVAMVYEDTIAPGVDWACIGYKPTLQSRQSWTGTGSAANIAQVVVQSQGLGPTDSFGGMIVLDVTVSFR